MGRRAASIGFALGGGISQGISDKRRQLAQEKRDKELADAAMLRIAEQHQNRLALQQSQDAIRDANILKTQQDADAFWRGMLQTRGVDTKNIPFGLNRNGAGVMLDQLNRKEAADRASKEAIATQGANVNLLKTVVDATKESSPGGKTITGEEKLAAVEVGHSLKAVEDAIGLVSGEKQGKSPEQIRYETSLATVRAKSIPSPEDIAELEVSRRVYLQSLGDVQPNNFTEEILGEAINSYIERNGGTEAQAYDVILSNMTPEQQQKALLIVPKEVFSVPKITEGGNGEFIRTLSRIGGSIREGGGVSGALRAAFGGRETRPLTKEEMAIGGFGQTAEKIAKVLETREEPVSAGIRLLPPKKKKKETAIDTLGRRNRNR